MSDQLDQICINTVWFLSVDAVQQATRPATDYTARLIPQHEAVVVPLEEAHILWKR